MTTLEMKLYSIPETAKVLGISRSKMWQLVREGKIQTCRIGTRILVTPVTLQAILEGKVDLVS